MFWRRALSAATGVAKRTKKDHGMAAVPISIAEMLQLSGVDRKTSSSKHFPDRSFNGKLSTEAQVLEEVVVVSFVEDEHDEQQQHQQVCVFVCNFACSTWSSQQARLWFPRGARVSIREPVLSFAADGTPCLEVLNPASFDITGMNSDSECEREREGMDALSRGEFIKAGHLLSSSTSPQACRAWLTAGLLDRTVSDADRHPDSATALAAKGNALMRMQEFRTAYACFQRLPGDDDDGRQLREGCRKMIEWSESGPACSELEAYYVSRESGEYAPECPDFVGPVSIGPAPFGKGRGLFATRDIGAGDVIFACNPLVSLCGTDGLPSEQDMVATLVRNCLSSQRCLEQLLCLVESEDIPDLGLLKPNSDWTASALGELVDLPACASKTSTNYGYKFERLIGTDRRREYLSGLWVLTAFANHSCEPNASQRAVGAVSLVRAGRDISRGEEVTLPYLDPLQPWDTRSKQTRNKWGFECACERCNFERQLHAENSRLLGGLGDKIEQLSSDRDLFELGQAACRIETELRHLSEREKRWVRTSYYRAYEVHLLNKPEFEKMSGRSMDGVSWVELMESLCFTASGYEGLLTILGAFAQQDGSHQARELVTTEITSCYGKLSPHALETICGFVQADLDTSMNSQNDSFINK